MAGYSGQRGQLKQARIGDVDLLIETVPVAGDEQTSGRAEEAIERVSAAFDRGQDTIVAIATKLAGTVTELGVRSVRPDHVQVEFGLSFSATGNVIVAGSTVEATLKVSITYDRPEQPKASPSQVIPAATSAGSGSPVPGV
jgi:Trypsin-co-occurring domain 1